jgi:PhnB protein
MASKVKPIPDDYQSAIPYLCVKDAAAAIEFYKKAFGAIEVLRIPDPSGKVGHAEIKIGNAPIMLSDEYPEMQVVSPQTLGGTSVTIMIYFNDVDALAKQAVAAGAKLVRPVEDQFYGERSGKLEDPFGHWWSVATRTEDMTPEEMKKRAKALFG